MIIFGRNFGRNFVIFCKKFASLTLFVVYTFSFFDKRPGPIEQLV